MDAQTQPSRLCQVNRMVNDTQLIGCQILSELDSQSETLNRIEGHSEHISTGLDWAKYYISKVSSIFNRPSRPKGPTGSRGLGGGHHGPHGCLDLRHDDDAGDEDELDHLARGVANLKQMSIHIGEVLDSQNDQLDRLNEQVDGHLVRTETYRWKIKSLM